MPSNTLLLQTLLIGYAIGSIPFAYLITRVATGRDVRREGSGNVGTRNALRVSQKKWVGVVVLLADMLKGAAPVLSYQAAGKSDITLVLIPALVLGHCYPIWLRFHGGKGLATTAGALLVTAPIFPLFWGAAYLVAKRLRDDVDFASIMACGAALLALLILPEELIRSTTLGLPESNALVQHVVQSVGLVVLIILSRHVNEFIVLVKSGFWRASE